MTTATIAGLDATAAIAAEVAAASTMALGRAAIVLAGMTGKTAEDRLFEKLVNAELDRRQRRKSPRLAFWSFKPNPTEA